MRLLRKYGVMIAVTLALAVSANVAAGCKPKKKNPGEKLGEAIEDAGDAIEDASE